MSIMAATSEHIGNASRGEEKEVDRHPSSKGCDGLQTQSGH
jgi:hypothetical protein